MTSSIDQIRQLDAQIAELISQRLTLSENINITEVDGLTAPVTGDNALLQQTLNYTFSEINSSVRKQLQRNKVAFLGTPGTFTHQASISHFGHSCDYLPQKEISDVFNAVQYGDADYGVVPVENSTEGAVSRTLDMLTSSEIRIIGEVTVKVTHNLLSNEDLESIKKVYSHPQALAQCNSWLLAHLPHAIRIETASTTAGAEIAAKEAGAAAIASASAAEHNSVNILARHIEDIKGNTTRFMVISNHDTEPSGNDKTSLLFSTKDQSGALYDALKPFKDLGISMTMIESRPSKRQTWEYLFFIDFLGHVKEEVNQQLLERLSEFCQYIKVLGSYPRAE